MVGFEKIKNIYKSCPNFAEIFIVLRDDVTRKVDDFIFKDRYLFHSHKLWIPRTFLRDFLVWVLHDDGLVGHLDKTKRLKLWRIFSIGQVWIEMLLGLLVSVTHTCQLVKQRMQNTSLYTLPFLNCSWQDVSVNFVLGFSNTAWKHDSIFVVVDRFLKMTHFLSCSKISYVSQIATIYFNEVSGYTICSRLSYPTGMSSSRVILKNPVA